MVFIIMCGGEYTYWEKPRQLCKIQGEEIIARTIRLLKKERVSNIAISTNTHYFDHLDVPILRHENTFRVSSDVQGYWVDAFYPTEEETCYIFGDVVFSPEAIKQIVNTPTDDIAFFASAPPYDERYIKKWAEPFAFKVVNMEHFKNSIQQVKDNFSNNVYKRHPIAWELWQAICGTEPNKILYNYNRICDYTCDVDEVKDIAKIEEAICRSI